MKSELRPLPSAAPFFLELLEPRIAPAGVASAEWITATDAGGPFLLKAGQGLSIGAGGGGALLYVEAGQALVFTTDLNGNNLVDMNEITGIAAGDGLRLIAFADINGDIVTNLNADGTLTDSDGNSANGFDGRVVLNSRIDSIVLRSVVAGEVPDPAAAVVKSSYSIFGNIYAGGGLGSPGAQGLLIDTSGFGLQQQAFRQLTLADGTNPVPMLGYIFTGSAVSGQSFSFGTATTIGNGPAESLRGVLENFFPAAGQAGGDVNGVQSIGEGGVPADFYLGGILTGNGGAGARGGDISGVSSVGDIGGLILQTGSGGDGESGGRGGDINNLSITNSVNSWVEIRTGNGGFGLVGAAGRAGDVTFGGEVEVYGRLLVGLGNGGSAIGNAGSGNSLGNAIFTNPGVGLQTPTELITTWRLPGDIGEYQYDAGTDSYFSRQFDFDGDTFNDAVFLSDNANQLVVLFGNAAGVLEFREGFSQLDAPSYAPLTARASAVVVAEIGGPTGPGATPLPDIVTASSSGTSGVGLVSFVNLGRDENNVWQGFAFPRYSPLPGAGIPGVSPAGIGIGNTSLAGVTGLAAGDFTRDGVVDIAFIETRFDNTNIPFVSNLIVMSGLTGANGRADGYFAADFNKGSGLVPGSSPAVNVEFGRRDSEPFSYQLKASAGQQGNVLSDVIGYLDRTDPVEDPFRFGNTRFHLLQMADTATGQDLTRQTGPFGTPLLYSERVVADVGGTEQWAGYGAPQPVSAYNFEFLDVDNNGYFDAVTIGNVRPLPGSSAEPFLAAAVLQGDDDPITPGLFVIAQQAQDDETNFATVEAYFGIALTERREGGIIIPSVLGENWTDVVNLGMATGSYFAGTGFSGTNIVLNVIRDDNSVARAFTAGLVQYATPSDPTVPVFTRSALPFLPRSAFSSIGTENLTQTSLFAPWQRAAGVAADMNNVGFLFNPLGQNPETQWTFRGQGDAFRVISIAALGLQAGAGGDSSLGRGGSGGNLGTSAFGSLSINGYALVALQGGAGGSGYTGGGNGGGIAGVAIVANSLTGLTGAGGAAMAGSGGVGGSVSQFSFQGTGTNPNVVLVTGGGGFGLIGGAGGNVLGAGSPLSADVRSVTLLQVTTGNGGFGITRGGAGGSITNFSASLIFGEIFSLGTLGLRAGDGGAAVSGVGGAGGAIISSAPVPSTSQVSRPLLVQAGDGGNGLTGGVGGGVLDFVNVTKTPPANPDTVRIFAGHGGTGVTGNGGAGGNLTSITVSGEALGALSLYLAGHGGASAAAAGGAGGSIINLQGAAVAGGAMVVAGAGGDGLTVGGAGGSIRQSNVSVGANDAARLLFMAGQGGAAYGVSERQITLENTAPAPLAASPKMFAFGVVNGRAGNGGDLANVRQVGSSVASTDLIAGNGGSLINYGRGFDTNLPVGRGGSVTNVVLTGDAGVMNRDVPIRSYTFDLADRLRDGTITTVNDPGVGNVGVLAGGKGFVRNDRGTSAGVIGSVDGFSARNIMSMVAGSVDRVAQITAITNLQLTGGNNAVLGAAKNDPLDPLGPPWPAPYRNPATTPAYLAPDGVTITREPQQGGSLIDGAIFALRYTGTLSSPRLFAG